MVKKWGQYFDINYIAILNIEFKLVFLPTKYYLSSSRFKWH